MKFQQITTDRLAVIDVTEWDEEVDAFLKDLTALERLVFNDHFLTFYDKSKPAGERFHAGFRAAQMAIVDKGGAPLLRDSDEEAASKASLEPILRVFTYYLKNDERGEGAQLETAKKN